MSDFTTWIRALRDGGVEGLAETTREATAALGYQGDTVINSLGDIVVCGSVWGRVRALVDEKGDTVEQAGPSMPVEILGLDGVPEPGDALVEERLAKFDAMGAFEERPAG